MHGRQCGIPEGDSRISFESADIRLHAIPPQILDARKESIAVRCSHLLLDLLDALCRKAGSKSTAAERGTLDFGTKAVKSLLILALRNAPLQINVEPYLGESLSI